MKKLLIIVFAVIFILAGCSAGKTDAPAANEDSNAAIEENNNEITKGETEAPDEPEEAGKPEEPIESEIEEIPEETPEAEQPEGDAEVDSPEELPVTAETTEEAPSVDEQQVIAENVLKVKGLVDNELSLSLDELKGMSDIIFEADFYWLNNFGTTGYTHFKGVKLWNLLESKALIKSEASKISITAQDGYSMEFTIEQVKMEYMDETNPDNRYPMIIAWEENGEEYSTDEGAPYKLAVGQKEPGDINKPQWVSNIDVIIIE